MTRVVTLRDYIPVAVKRKGDPGSPPPTRRGKGASVASAGAAQVLSPNRFSPLSGLEPELDAPASPTGEDADDASDVTAMDGVASGETPSSRRIRVPPIMVYGFERYRDLVAFIRLTIGSECDFLVTSRRDSFQVRLHSLDSYRTLTRELTARQVRYHTYDTGEVKTRKYVLRGLSSRQTAEDIKSDLALDGFPAVAVKQMSRAGPDRTPLPLFVVTTPVAPDAKPLSSMRRLGHSVVTVEAYRGSKGPQMCFKCQRFGHQAAFCSHPPRCFKCAQGHEGRECTKPPTVPALCCNCGGEHPASYRRCEAYVAAITRHDAAGKEPRRQAAGGRRPLPASTVQVGRSFSAAVSAPAQPASAHSPQQIPAPAPRVPATDRSSASAGTARWQAVLDVCATMLQFTTSPVVRSMVALLSAMAEEVLQHGP